MAARAWAFRIGAVAVGVTASLTLLVGLDVYAHARLAKYAALNVWGYRGPIAPGKRPDEWRVAVVGGSTVLGLGLPWEQAFPALLERDLRRTDSSVSVVNLGFDGENARAFRPTLEDYAYLHYDAVILYEGYNNLVQTASGSLRRRSLVFRWTGYYPILPTAIREKFLLWKYHDDLAAAYRDRPVFRGYRPDAPDAAAVAEALRRQVGELTRTELASDPRATGVWDQYLGGMRDAISHARQHGKAVLVVTQPYISNRHVAQLWAARLSSTPTSPRRSVGTRTCST